MRQRYQGENIDFDLKFEKGENQNINSFVDFSSITVFMFTDGCHIAKFKTPNKSGYDNFKLEGDETLSGILTSESTKLMHPGALFIEINAEYQGEINMIKRMETGISIIKNLIKSES